MLSLGLIIEGLLGGFVSYTAAIHAYAFDVASSPVSRPVLFAALNAISLAGFMLGAVIGKFSTVTLAYVLAILIALPNLTFIYVFLPESLKPQQDAVQPALPQRSLLKSIVSPISVFYRGPGSRKHLPLFALAFYVYSLTSATDTGIASYDWADLLPPLPRWFLITAPRALTLLTLLLLLPALAWLFQRRHGSSERAGLHLATSLAHHSLLLGAASATGILVFCINAYSYPYRRGVLYPLFSIAYPFASAVAQPALYALGASYLIALRRGGEVGELFGALAVWGALGENVSYSIYGGGTVTGPHIFWWTSFFTVIALLLLLPDPPPVGEEVATGVEQEGLDVDVQAEGSGSV
ncbi:hypothetical protein C8R46DRAFT_1227038 [Mycena filopes]|nr:hypothetical protein C8R46DRAFT_1227038 [Mycena filopes]